MCLSVVYGWYGKNEMAGSVDCWACISKAAAVCPQNVQGSFSSGDEMFGLLRGFPATDSEVNSLVWRLFKLHRNSLKWYLYSHWADMKHEPHAISPRFYRLHLKPNLPDWNESSYDYIGVPLGILVLIRERVLLQMCSFSDLHCGCWLQIF